MREHDKSLELLFQKMDRQAEQLTELTKAVRNLLQTVADPEPDDEDEPVTYLNGRPV